MMQIKILKTLQGSILICIFALVTFNDVANIQINFETCKIFKVKTAYF